MEQAIKYEILTGNYPQAERLIEELAEPLHYWGEQPWISELRVRLDSHRAGRVFDPCAPGTGDQ